MKLNMYKEWSYNPINYYLLIFKRDKIVDHFCYGSVYAVVLHLLTFDRYEIPDEVLLQKEIDIILSREFGNAKRYDDGTFGVIFSSKWVDKQDIKDSNHNSRTIKDIYSLIKSSERDKKLGSILK